MNRLAPDDRIRLTRLLGMLGSDHDGERANAGALAHRLVHQRGLQWDDVIATPMIEHAPQRRAEPRFKPPEWLDDLFLGKRHLGHCTVWEQHFLASISATARLSTKQRLVLERIADGLRARGLA